MNKKIMFLICVQLCCMTLALAEEPEVRASGFVYYQIGQLMHVTPDEGQLDKPWDQHFNGRLTLSAKIKEQLKVIVGAEAELGVNINDQKTKKTVFLKEAQGIYSFGDPESPFLQIATGYFAFKYSPAQNLGEYLFRSGSYPQYIITDFDFAKSRLAGFRISSNLLGEKLDLHALITSETNVNPYFDYSLSFVAGYRPLESGILDLGAGIMYDRLIPIIPSRTTSSAYVVTDDSNNVIYEKDPVIGKDAYGIDSIIEPGKPKLYTMKGTKVMGRITFDPKPLLPFADIMGEEDAKIYGEIAFLGLQNYGAHYYDINKRRPIMFGFNVPCFKIIDIASVEFEYYPTDTAQKMDIPTTGNPTPTSWSFGERSFRKWSVYVKKTIVSGLAFKGLVGRDHYRFVNAGGNYDPIERMNGKKDWHYKARFMFSF